jgi:formylglycine-generating enzyme required for sulfatase activity/energy-coupling factor transporter ATP-binding protein EcfA2
MIYTFYSYKGGVGRTMALANVAELFYRSGLKVLMVDWDLEAPGLERFFPLDLDEVLDKPGVIDMLLGYKAQMAQGLNVAEDEEELPFEKPSQFMVDIYPEARSDGRLWLLPSGRRSKEHFADYAYAVRTFDWQDFYENWEGELYFEWLRQQFEQMADVVLIDSRTGVTEMGGVCVYQFADVVVLFCSANQQSLDGTQKMLIDFKQSQVQELRGRPLETVVVPARIEDAESDFLDEFQQEFIRRFVRYKPEALGVGSDQFWRLAIPYVPRYAYRETIAVRERAKASSEEMVEAFSRLTLAISRLAPPNSLIRSSLPEKTMRLGDTTVVGSVIGDHLVVAGEGSTVVIGEPIDRISALDRDSALAHYLRHVISRNRYLRLQGIRSGGKLVHIELEEIYVTLRATRTVEAERAWLEDEASLAPGEAPPRHPEHGPRTRTETVSVSVSVEEALASDPRLVILGDPGSGKTTLLRYLALLYARDLAEGKTLVQEQLGLEESGRLPILLPLRRVGAYLKAHRPVDDGTEGHTLLLRHCYELLEGERVNLPQGFFEPYLESGQAVIVLDGLDEVADPDLRRRVSRLVEAFTAAYPDCRYVVASRIMGYKGAARLGEKYATTTIRDFLMSDVERFLHNWHRAVAVGQMGPGRSAEAYAEGQTQALLAAIRENERIRELAINPLMLTVIALVHRDRVKLPDRRAELYDEAVNVLLGKWDEARGVRDIGILEKRPFDAGDRRLMLQAVALWMQERQQKEIEVDDLQRILGGMFHGVVGDRRAVERTVDRFLRVIQERTGLLSEHGLGVYRFSHRTFQEYLAALAVAGRDDYVAYTLERADDPWWREVILLEAGYMSTQSRERTTRLIRAIADRKKEPEPYHNLILASECLRDAGSERLEKGLQSEIQTQLRQELEPPKGWFASVWVMIRHRMTVEEMDRHRLAAAQALAHIGENEYWTPPYGEPEWIEISGGEFWMGERAETHRFNLDTYYISRVPITNAQYLLFVEATGREPPEHWGKDCPPKSLGGHPVVNVTWYDALAYCKWLSQFVGEQVMLPSEAEWEKAARGAKDQRRYPWGDEFDTILCNSQELRLDATTPVGIFSNGASPYGVLDLAGNVWEWTTNLWGKNQEEAEFEYPYRADDGRENVEADDNVLRVLRGGAFDASSDDVRCCARHRELPSSSVDNCGFRIVWTLDKV